MWFPRITWLVAFLICVGCQEAAPTGVPIPKRAAAPSEVAREAATPPHSIAQTVPQARSLAPAREVETAAQITFRDLAFDWSQIDMTPPKWYESDSERRYTYDPSLVPSETRALQGRRVTLVGKMPSIDEDANVHQFLLLKDFNARAKLSPPLDQQVMVTLRGGLTTAYEFSHLMVRGLFRVDEWIDPENPDGNPILVYHLDDAIVLHPTP